MRTRLLAPLAVLVLVLAGAATATAATGVFESHDSGVDSPRDIAERGTAVTGATTPTVSLPAATPPSTTLPDDHGDDNDVDNDNPTPTVGLAPGATQTFAAGDAGSVTVGRDGDTLTVLSVNANAGFTSEVEQGAGTEVEVQFADGSVRVDFNAELDDGAVRVRVRVTSVAVDNPGTTTSTIPTTTPTTMPDDNRGPGNANDNVDNRGPGNAHDGVDDDHSGPDGHGGSGHGGSGSGGSGH